jgi:hypothetical protein
VPVDDFAVLAQHCKCSFDCRWVETSGRIDSLTKPRDAHQSLNLRPAIDSDEQSN